MYFASLIFWAISFKIKKAALGNSGNIMKGVIDSLTHLHSGKAFDIFRQKLQHFVNKNNIILSLPTNEG